MSALVGETVVMRLLVGRDQFDVPIYEDTEINNCVITPKGTGGGINNNYFFSSEKISILAPVFLPPIDDKAQFIVRGESYSMDGLQFDHKSVFGTGAGGTEIPVTRTEI